MGRKHVIGLDFGTESARALLVAVDNGEEVAMAVEPFADGVIDVELPGSGRKLEPEWALTRTARPCACRRPSRTTRTPG